MNIGDREMDLAIRNGIISEEQAEELVRLWSETNTNRPRFDMIHLLYYLGAILVMAAMTWFLTSAWEDLSGLGVALIGTLYLLAFRVAGSYLWRRGEQVPGGLLYTISVCLVPLVIYGIEKELGIFPKGTPGSYHDFYEWISGGWIWMELATLVYGGWTLKKVRFPFLTAPIAFVLWFVSMDLTPLFFGRIFTWHDRQIVSIVFGLVMIGIAFIGDRRSEEDFSFWIYLFGLAAFWGGLSSMHSDSEFSKAIYCLINILLMITAIVIQRRTFMVFGSLGLLGYLGHLAWETFADSFFFPIVLTLIGVTIIWTGLKYKRHQKALEDFLTGILPLWLRRRLPQNRI